VSALNVHDQVVRLCAKHVREDFQEFRLKAKWAHPLSLRVLELGTCVVQLERVSLRIDQSRSDQLTSRGVCVMAGWAASVQRLVNKCGASLRVLALRIQFSTVDATAMIQHIAQQYPIPAQPAARTQAPTHAHTIAIANRLLADTARRCRCGPRLRELSLDDITDQGMEALALNCPNLCVVDCTTGIQFDFALKGKAPTSFVNVCKNATSLRHLRFLSVPYEHLPQLVAAAEFTQLETLELDGMNDDLQDDDGYADNGDAQITPATMLSDIVGKFPRLRSLGLTNYELPLTFFSASSLSTTATRYDSRSRCSMCPVWSCTKRSRACRVVMRVPASLTSLNLTGSYPSEIDVEAIGSEMPHLEELDVTQSSSFDDALVEAFCRGHDRRRSRLRVFKVTDTGVTVDGVKVRRRVLRCR
jgi:hypothetical protein